MINYDHPKFFGITIKRTFEPITRMFLKINNFADVLDHSGDTFELSIRELYKYIEHCDNAIYKSCIEIRTTEKRISYKTLQSCYKQACDALSELSKFRHELRKIELISYTRARDMLKTIIKEIKRFDEKHIVELRGY